VMDDVGPQSAVEPDQGDGRPGLARRIVRPAMQRDRMDGEPVRPESLERR